MRMTDELNRPSSRRSAFNGVCVLASAVAVFATLPGEFTLDTLSAHETASGKPRAYLRQLVVRWSKEGRIKRTDRGMYQKI